MNGQEIFALEENENNERKYELIKLITSGEAVLIVGAGSSRRVGYPTWNGLLKKLEDLAIRWGDSFQPNEGKFESAPLVYAEEIQSSMCRAGHLGKYHALLYRSFDRKSPSFDDFHRRLVLLPFRGILTTNYDKVLEAALGEIERASAFDNSLVIDEDSAERVHEFLMEMIDESMPRRIAHLHGRYDYPKNIILSSEDYKKTYGLEPSSEEQVPRVSEWTLHRKLLWALLATRRVVFIGFSMKDPYINRALYAVSKDLWRWDKSVHYAILGISPDGDGYSKAEELKHDCGVDTVFYRVFDDSLDDPHQELYDTVKEIAEGCGVEIQSTIIPQEQSDDNDRSKDKESESEDKAPEPVASESEDVLSWLEENNQDMERRIDDEN